MRTTIVSTTNLKVYRTTILAIDAIFFIFFLSFILYKVSISDDWTTMNTPIVFYIISNIHIAYFLKLKNVSYDNSSIYYNKKDYEVQLPFEEIKSIQLITVTGIYAIKLFTPSQGEKEIYFKTSLWYPLNFKKKDEMVDELREKIDAYKRTLPQKHLRGLTSRSI